jgi:ubiquinone/menaquinone biosynthesis C-methylase UbiE
MMSPDEVPVSRSVVAYDQELIPWLFQHWAESFVRLMAPIGSSVLDLACGSGLIARQLLNQLDADGRIHGVDFDPEMLTYARSTLDDPRVSWHESDVESLPFDDQSFDVVCCHQGLQFFPEPVAALIEVRRVLRPSGKLVVAVWGRFDDNPWPAALANAVRSLLGESAGDSMLAVCRLGEPDDLAKIIEQAGLTEPAIHLHHRTANHPDVRQAINSQLTAMPSGSAVGDLDTEQRNELSTKMSELLAKHTSPTQELSVPSTSILATATNPS